jgi:DNA invertase Pin-like site-specific DNA recombinase
MHVSTSDQHPKTHTDQLKDAGCERIFTDHGVSPRKASRPELGSMLDYVGSGDVVCILKPDRLGPQATMYTATADGIG